MVWPMVAAVAASGLMQGMQSNKAERKAVNAQNKAAYKQNLMNWQETQAGLLALEGQRSALRQQTTKSLQLAVRTANQSRGATRADIAAVGIKGNTSEQVMNDIERDYQEHQFELENQHLYGIHDIDQTGINMIAAALAGNSPMQKAHGTFKDALVNAGLQAAQTYAGSYFQFGAGAGSAPTTTTTRSPASPGRTPLAGMQGGNYGISAGALSSIRYGGGTLR